MCFYDLSMRFDIQTQVAIIRDNNGTYLGILDAHWGKTNKNYPSEVASSREYARIEQRGFSSDINDLYMQDDDDLQIIDERLRYIPIIKRTLLF